MPPSTVALSVGEGGQPTNEVGSIVVATEVTPSTPSSVLAKRKRDDATRPSGRKKSKAPMSLCVLRQATRLGPTVGRRTTTQDIPLAHLTIEASVAATATSATSAPSPHVAVVQEVSPIVVKVVAPATQADSVMVSSSIVAAPLLSVDVMTIGALTVLPPSSSALVVLPAIILAAMVSPFSSSHPRVSLDHLCTSSDTDSLWSVTYKPRQKTPVGFVSAFDRNLSGYLGC